MLIIDDILFFPARSLLWMVRELYKAAQEELITEAETITAELSELYMMLETGRITESEFDAREKELLDRLDAIHKRSTRIDDERNEEEQDYNEHELEG